MLPVNFTNYVEYRENVLGILKYRKVYFMYHVILYG